MGMQFYRFFVSSSVVGWIEFRVVFSLEVGVLIACAECCLRSRATSSVSFRSSSFVSILD